MDNSLSKLLKRELRHIFLAVEPKELPSVGEGHANNRAVDSKCPINGAPIRLEGEDILSHLVVRVDGIGRLKVVGGGLRARNVSTVEGSVSIRPFGIIRPSGRRGSCVFGTNEARSFRRHVKVWVEANK